LKSTGLAVGFRLSDMKTDYTPKVGDLVTSQDHNEVYKVLDIMNGDMIELQLFHIGKQEFLGPVMKVPRSRLKPFKEDASQAAARIVREATKTP
jgi:hypothetical protein